LGLSHVVGTSLVQGLDVQRTRTDVLLAALTAGGDGVVIGDVGVTSVGVLRLSDLLSVVGSVGGSVGVVGVESGAVARSGTVAVTNTVVREIGDLVLETMSLFALSGLGALGLSTRSGGKLRGGVGTMGTRSGILEGGLGVIPVSVGVFELNANVGSTRI
jgi:hypothetical protein